MESRERGLSFLHSEPGSWVSAVVEAALPNPTREREREVNDKLQTDRFRVCFHSNPPKVQMDGSGFNVCCIRVEGYTRIYSFQSFVYNWLKGGCHLTGAPSGVDGWSLVKKALLEQCNLIRWKLDALKLMHSFTHTRAHIWKLCLRNTLQFTSHKCFWPLRSLSGRFNVAPEKLFKVFVMIERG